MRLTHLNANPSSLSLLTSFISLAWFLTAHILEYTSVNDCRFSSPHLWWLTFGILCILYVTILEIFLLGLLVFILGPVIYVRFFQFCIVVTDLTSSSDLHSCFGISSCCAWVGTRFKILITSSLKSGNSLSLLWIKFHLCSTSRLPRTTSPAVVRLRILLRSRRPRIPTHQNRLRAISGRSGASHSCGACLR